MDKYNILKFPQLLDDFVFVAPYYRKKYVIGTKGKLKVQYFRIDASSSEVVKIILELWILLLSKVSNKPILLSDIHIFKGRVLKKIKEERISVFWWNAPSELIAHIELCGPRTNYLHSATRNWVQVLNVKEIKFYEFQLHGKHIPIKYTIKQKYQYKWCFVGRVFDADLFNDKVLDNLKLELLKNNGSFKDLYIRVYKSFIGSVDKDISEDEFKMASYLFRICHLFSLSSENGFIAVSSAQEIKFLREIGLEKNAKISNKISARNYLKIAQDSELVLDYGSKAFYSFEYPRSMYLENRRIKLTRIINPILCEKF